MEEKTPHTFINLLRSEELLNVKTDVPSFPNVPEINVECWKELEETTSLTHTEPKDSFSSGELSHPCPGSGQEKQS